MRMGGMGGRGACVAWVYVANALAALPPAATTRSYSI